MLFGTVWLLVALLYQMHLSKLLIATNSQVASMIAGILVPFIIASLVFTLYSNLSPRAKKNNHSLLENANDLEDLPRLTKRLNRWLLFWGIMTVVEIIASGGIPLLWLLTGSSKNYLDFGIKSIHGFLNSLLLAAGICYTGLFARLGQRKYLLCFAGILVWAVLTVTRGLIVVNLVQSVIILALYRGMSTKLAIKIVATGLILVIAFGVVGDLRTGGSSTFRDLAQPTAAYPAWLPSGDLWVYIYLTTPLNNLIYTASSTRPLNDPLFPNTAAPLFPSVLRSAIYGDALSESISGELVDSAFNVSTAYVGPYQDYGAIGIACVSVLFGLLTAIYWKRNNFRDALIYSVLGGCLIITVFGNNFFSLPVISQLLWIYIFLYKRNPHAATNYERRTIGVPA